MRHKSITAKEKQLIEKAGKIKRKLEAKGINTSITELVNALVQKERWNYV